MTNADRRDPGSIALYLGDPGPIISTGLCSLLAASTDIHLIDTGLRDYQLLKLSRDPRPMAIVLNE